MEEKKDKRHREHKSLDAFYHWINSGEKMISIRNRKSKSIISPLST